MKRADVATPQWVGAADNAESFLLKGHVEQSDAREETEHEVRHPSES
jgi:hypothetical protein